jgi:hypothetical protein
MAFDPQPADGERVLSVLTVIFDRKGTERLDLWLTDRNVYFPGRRIFAVSDPVTTGAMPLSDIQEVAWRPPSAVQRYGIGVGLMLVGGILSFGMLVAGEDSIIVGMPTAMLLAGPLFPFLARKKRYLESQGTKGRFRGGFAGPDWQGGSGEAGEHRGGGRGLGA